MKLNKLISIPVIALAAGLGLAACGGQSAPAPTATVTAPTTQSNGLPAGVWFPAGFPNVACGPPTSGTNGLNTSYTDDTGDAAAGQADSKPGYIIDMDDPKQSPCNGSSPNSDVTNAPKPAAHKTLKNIMKNEAGSTTFYTNYWSNGSVTTCIVSYPFADGAQSATGDCAPDGVPNGISGGNVPPN